MMLRKLAPVIACLVFCILAAIGTSVAKSYWSAAENMSFRAGEDAMMDADLVQSASIDPIVIDVGQQTMSKAVMEADVAWLRKAVSGRSADKNAKIVSDAFGMSDVSSVRVMLANWDGSRAVYLLVAGSDGRTRAAFVSHKDGSWQVMDVHDVASEEVVDDARDEQ